MKFQMTQEQYQFILNATLPLKELGCSLWCFGSRAKGSAKKFSDLDLLVEIPHNTNDLTQIKRTLFRIMENIEESNFPFKVDLVLDCYLAQEYKSSILKEKIPY